MRHDELLRTVAAAPRDDWQNDDDTGVHVFKPDVDIRLVERRQDDEHGTGFTEEWHQGLPDSEARRKLVDLFYRSTPVETFLMVVVDGGRCVLPCPDRTEENGWSITGLQYSVARAMDLLTTVDEYLERCGITVEESYLPRIRQL